MIKIPILFERWYFGKKELEEEAYGFFPGGIDGF